ncbi:MAG: hypothetical protein ACWGN1_06410 [Desulfobulbales bacterium]
MKKTMYLITLVVAILIAAWSAGAQMMGGSQSMMNESGRQQERMPTIQDEELLMIYPSMAGCYGMGPGMMMGGYGMGPGMMGGYGMGPGMMGGYGMGPGMMGGYGMGSGMMGGYGMGHMNRHMMDEYGWGRGKKPFSSPENYNKFLDETKDLRKELHDMQFEYGEMMRNPKTTMGDLKKMQQEMFELQKKLLEKSARE